MCRPHIDCPPEKVLAPAPLISRISRPVPADKIGSTIVIDPLLIEIVAAAPPSNTLLAPDRLFEPCGSNRIVAPLIVVVPLVSVSRRGRSLSGGEGRVVAPTSNRLFRCPPSGIHWCSPSRSLNPTGATKAAQGKGKTGAAAAAEDQPAVRTKPLVARSNVQQAAICSHVPFVQVKELVPPETMTSIEAMTLRVESLCPG